MFWNFLLLLTLIIITISGGDVKIIKVIDGGHGGGGHGHGGGGHGHGGGGKNLLANIFCFKQIINRFVYILDSSFMKWILKYLSTVFSCTHLKVLLNSKWMNCFEFQSNYIRTLHTLIWLAITISIYNIVYSNGYRST